MKPSEDMSCQMDEILEASVQDDNLNDSLEENKHLETMRN